VDSTASAVEDGGVQNISRIKIYRTPIFVNGLYKLLLLDKRRWIQAQKRLKTEEFEYFAGVFGQTPSPHSKPHKFGTPLVHPHL